MWHSVTVEGRPATRSRLVTRQLRGGGARLRVNFPELGRTVELEVQESGAFFVNVGPAPGIGGGFVNIYSGAVTDEV